MGCTVSEITPKGFRRRASWFWVSGLSLFPHVAQGRSGSATRAATSSAEVMISESPNAFRISASSSTLSEATSCPSPDRRQAASLAARASLHPPGQQWPRAGANYQPLYHLED